MRFEIILLFLIIITACGPKPYIKPPELKTPDEVWSEFTGQYNSINSLAFSGDLTIKADKVYNCKLQLLYIAPDSFAFLAEGTLGIDLARGAIIGSSGFWEIPREKYHEKIQLGDRIYFENDRFWIDIEQLLQAVFFFRENTGFQFERKHNSKFVYTADFKSYSKLFEIDRKSSTPVKQFVYTPEDTVTVEYYDWKMSKKSNFPRSLMIKSNVSNSIVEYKIKKLRINPEIKAKYFQSKF